MVGLREGLTWSHGASKAQTQSMVNSVLKSIVNAAASGEEVSLPGFGRSKVMETPECEGRNPASGEKTRIAASLKRVVAILIFDRDLDGAVHGEFGGPSPETSLNRPGEFARVICLKGLSRRYSSPAY